MASANPIFAVEQGNRNKNFVKKNSFDFFGFLVFFSVVHRVFIENMYRKKCCKMKNCFTN